MPEKRRAIDVEIDYIKKSVDEIKKGIEPIGEIVKTLAVHDEQIKTIKNFPWQAWIATGISLVMLLIAIWPK